MGVEHTLARQVTEKLEKQFLALVGVTKVTLRSRHRIQDLVESLLRIIVIVLFETLEAHRDVAAVAALGAAETDAIVVVIVIDHQADPHAVERVEDLAERASQHIEKRVGTVFVHIAFVDQRLTFAVRARCRTEIRTVIQREHHHRLAARGQTGTWVHVDVRVVRSRRPDRANKRCKRSGKCDFLDHGIHT